MPNTKKDAMTTTEPSAGALFPNRCTYGVPLEDAMAAVDAAYRRGMEETHLEWEARTSLGRLTPPQEGSS